MSSSLKEPHEEELNTLFLNKKNTTTNNVEDTNQIQEAPSFVLSDITKPFNFVSGNATKKKRSFFNFRKKASGLQNVMIRIANKRRIICKNGNFNIINSNQETKSHRLLKDIFITILDFDWIWIFTFFASSFFLSWLIFALIWYLTFLQHGDFNEQNRNNETFVPCVSAIEDFASCFLFSIETQHTIGYGGRATTEQCPMAIIIMCLQSILGVIIQACLAGIIFAKFTVPRKRGETVIFSKNAVITMRNGCLYLMCRLSDLRKCSLLEAHIRMILIREEKSNEGEIMSYQQTELVCGSDPIGSNERIMLLWPVTISHRIDSESPLYNLHPQDLNRDNFSFEILVVLEGVTEETGNSMQARTSYLPMEILWGHRFQNNTVEFDPKESIYVVYNNRISQTIDDQTPKKSAQQLSEDE